MNIIESLNIPERKKTVKYVSEKITWLNRIINKYSADSSISDVTQKDLENMVSLAEESAVIMRSTSQNINEQFELRDKDVMTSLLSDYPISISYENNTLEISLPYLFRGSRVRSFPICEYLKFAMDQHKRKYGTEFFIRLMRPPFCVIAKRYIKSANSRVSDNDNFAMSSELLAVINTVLLEMMLRDDSHYMSFYSVFVPISECTGNEHMGTKLLFFKRNKENLARHLDDLL